MRTLACLALALVLVSGVAAAKGASPAQKCLSGGRQLAKKGRHNEAIAAFKACLEATPHDATVESELAAEAVVANDLDLAETSARAAVADAADDAKIKAAALYDLGRVAEARKDRKAAIQAYTDSLAARSSAVVVERLRALDPKAAARGEKLVPAPLLGPYASFVEACKEHVADDAKGSVAAFQKSYLATFPEAREKLAEKTSEFESKWSCTCPDADEEGGLEEPTIGNLGRGFREARVFLSTCDVTGSSIAVEVESTFRVHLALKTAKGWYVADTISFDLPVIEMKKIHDVSLARRDGGPELVWTFDVTMGHTSHYVADESSETNLFVIGVGASGEPSEVDVRLAKSDSSWTAEEGHSRSVDAALKVSWNKAGQLVLSGKTDEDGLVGAHTLVFP